MCVRDVPRQVKRVSGQNSLSQNKTLREFLFLCVIEKKNIIFLKNSKWPLQYGGWSR